jgi:hypothetical protein
VQGFMPKRRSPVGDKVHSERWRHDVKKQLWIVLGYSELILQDMDKAHSLRGDLEEILKAAQQAMALVAELGEDD